MTLLGDVKYITLDQSIHLDNNYVNASDVKGTSFRIAYSFKIGYRYVVTVSSAALYSSGTNTGPYLRLDLTNNGSNGGTLCNGPQAINQNLSGNPGPFQYASTNYQDIVFAFSTPLTANSSSLEVSSIPATNGGLNSVRIRKIEITETAPIPTFTISPATSTIQCGSTASKIFTATNVFNSPGLSNYTWNLGNNNGWKLTNGNPAPATISTGTISTLTLVPDCGKIQSSISVTATVGGTNYNSNTATFSVGAPNLSISGGVTQCTSTTTYTLNGAPCNGVVTWSSSNTNIATVTQNGTSTTITKINAGPATISASVVACGQTYTTSKSIQFGGYSSTDYFISGPSSACPNQVINFGVNLLPGATGYTWTYPSAFTLVSGGNGYSNLYVRTGSSAAGGGPVGVRVANACDAGGSPSFKFVGVNNCFAIIISPNPSTDQATVSTLNVVGRSSENSSKTYITQILIHDQGGNLKKKLDFKTGIEQTTISLSDLKTGVYTLSAFDGKEWAVQKIVKQ